MSDYPDWWYRREARKCGTPPAVLDDAIQEMKIAVWMGRPARYACIDFLRREFGRKRNGKPQLQALADRQRFTGAVTMDLVDAWLDFRDSFSRLPALWGRVVALGAIGYRDVEISVLVRRSDRRVGQIRQQAARRLAHACCNRRKQ